MRLFFSYSSNDQALADQLRQGFQELGVEVKDPGFAASGTHWAGRVRSSIEESDAVLLIVPRSGAPGANNAFFEVGAAQALGKPVMAVLPEEPAEEDREVPSDLAGQMVLGTSGRPMKSIAASVVSALKVAA